MKAATDKEAREAAQIVEGSKAGLEMIKLQRTLANQKEIAERQTQKTAKEQTKKGK